MAYKENRRTYFGFEIGGGHISSGEVQFDYDKPHNRGKIEGFNLSNLVRTNLNKNRGRDDILDLIKKRIAGINRQDIEGIGIACPGVIEDGRVLLSFNLRELQGRDITGELREETRKVLGYEIPVYLENDARLAALAEWHLGKGKELTPHQLKARTLTLINIGTGFTARTISDGKIIPGANNIEGELGAYTGDLLGRILDITCSGQYFTTRYGETSEELFITASSDTESKERTEARQKFTEFGLQVGEQIYQRLSYVLDSNRVVFTGGVSNAFEFIYPGMKSRILQRIKGSLGAEIADRVSQNIDRVFSKSELEELGVLGATLYSQKMKQANL